MRASILSAACAAALAVIAWSPAEAKAQVIINPVVTTSPYSSLYTPYGGYWTPNYNYGYGYSYSSPYANSWGYSYANPFSYGTYGWSNYSYNPYLSAHPYGFMSWPNYMYRGRRY